MKIQEILERPTFYPYSIEGKNYVPKISELGREFFSKINILKDRRRWLAFSTTLINLLLIIPLWLFFHSQEHLSLGLYFLAFCYGFLVLNIHSTVYMHRFVSHRAFEFKNKWTAFCFRNLVVKIIPEEVFGVSHYVHHHLSDLPGDPYNAQSGWLFCFIADVNHQQLAKNLSEEDYNAIKKWMEHTLIFSGNYQNYLKWGTITSPWAFWLNQVGNWLFWFLIFWLIGGLTFSYLMFGICFFWFLSIRNFNYKAHGGGIDKRKRGVDYNQNDFAVNKPLPGMSAGEWHSHHHLFPKSARLDFLPGQIDLSWWIIKLLYSMGLVTSYVDSKSQFERKFLGKEI